MPQQATSTELVLSPSARRAGGAVARILSDSTEIVRYASGNVKSKDRKAIARLVDYHSELNTEKAVGGLIWLASFHGEPINKWIGELTQEYSLAEVSLVVEYLYDVGARTDKDSYFQDENEMTREYIPLILELLQYHKELEDEGEIQTVDQLINLVDAIGGFATIGDFDSPQRIREVLHDYRLGEEVMDDDGEFS